MSKASEDLEEKGTTFHPLPGPGVCIWTNAAVEARLGVETPPRDASLFPKERESRDVNSPSVTHLPVLSGLPGLRFLCGDMEILTGPPPPQGTVGLANARLCRNAW